MNVEEVVEHQDSVFDRPHVSSLLTLVMLGYVGDSHLDSVVARSQERRV